VVKLEVIRMAARYGKPIIAGAYTPTEALTAHESGADFVKLFPAEIGGAAYVKALLAPLPMLQIVPTGGITAENAADFLHAGSVALGVGGELVSSEILAKRDWAALRNRAEQFVKAVHKARGK
jgi:2-dehydro-3-deoxyphosphogluconate aldolase/(4S)-4-hydroxy-2-oxoglutarate aldolase